MFIYNYIIFYNLLCNSKNYDYTTSLQQHSFLPFNRSLFSILTSLFLFSLFLISLFLYSLFSCLLFSSLYSLVSCLLFASFYQLGGGRVGFAKSTCRYEDYEEVLSPEPTSNPVPSPSSDTGRYFDYTTVYCILIIYANLHIIASSCNVLSRLALYHIKLCYTILYYNII